MKLLYYNWADCCSREGGGVTVYLKSLLGSRVLEDHDVSMISSGSAYTLSGRHFWRPVRGNGMSRPARYEMVNSRLLAPALCAFGSPYEAVSPGDDEVFLDFIAKAGPFDVVHFHNLEGLSIHAVQLLRREFPKTRLVLSLHNYFPFCSQVNLYRHKEYAACTDFYGGRACLEECRGYAASVPAWQKLVKMAPALSSFRNLPGWRPLKQSLLGAASAWRALFGHSATARQDTTAGRHFAARRKNYVALLNSGFDLVLCVSERVREIALGFGLRPEILRTSYIGTSMSGQYKHAERQKTLPMDTATLTYLGYATHDKGFFFLLDALAHLPPTLCEKITIQLAARGCNGTVQALAQKTLSRFRELRLSDGYQRDTLGKLLSATDIGLVPNIWEDCLPQTALEMHCHNIPLFCSDRGGAKELANCPDFVFRAGDRADFVHKLEKILTGGVDLETYWLQARKPLSIEEHAASLVALYTTLTREKR